MGILDFDSLIQPLNRETFFSEHWEQRPLVVARDAPDWYDSLLSAEDLEFVLSAASSLNPSSVELLGRRAKSPRLNGDEGITALFEQFQSGATIRVRGVHRFRKGIQQFCRRLEQEFSFPIQANLYCTPANESGLEQHFDGHDVLILQISGRKHWRLFDPPVVLPLENVPPLRFERPENLSESRGNRFPKSASAPNYKSSDTLLECSLAPGDFMYLPRGFPHQAWTSDESSVHLTIGIHVITWLDLVTVTLGLAGNQNVELRRALPLGFANQNGHATDLQAKFTELLEALPTAVNLSDTLEELTGSFLSSRQSFGEGTLTVADQSQRVSIESVVERSEGLLLRLEIRAETIGLVSYSAIVESFWLPRVFEEPLRFIFQHTRFRVDELPGGLTNKARVNLVRKLVRGKLLRIQR
jgi:ribosomal protein L16 Arg81 hydroxylase